MLRVAIVLVCVLVASSVHAQPGLAPPLPQSPYERRPSDERLFLIPTDLTMKPGSLSVSDDEVLSARIAAGLARRLQLDLRIGGFLIPGAVGGGLALPGGIVAGGGAGAVVLGLVDLGAKVPILFEGESTPGVAVSYDVVDVFGVAAGGAGVALVGAGAAAGGVVAVGGVNLQLNLFALSVGKHYGRTHLIAGSYLLDNHHFLPQSAGFTSACGAGGVGSAGQGGKVEPCASGTTTIDRLPTQVQPFLGIERAVGENSSLAADVLLSSHAKDVVGTTGFRWIFGRRQLHVRLDLALLWSHLGYPVPWVGAGLHLR